MEVEIAHIKGSPIWVRICPAFGKEIKGSKDCSVGRFGVPFGECSSRTSDLRTHTPDAVWYL